MKQINYEGLVIDIDDNVYEPSDDSFLLADNLEVRPNDLVLDIGTGCGIQALSSAKRGRNVRVIAIDINPYSISCTKRNVKQNGYNNQIYLIDGSLVNALQIGSKFDLIIFNPPYIPEERNN